MENQILDKLTKTQISSLANVVQILGSFLNDEFLLLSIAIDEVQALGEILGMKHWKKPIKSIGGFMVDLAGANSNLQNVCLVPIISGVALDETMRFKATEYGNVSFSLPPLTAYNMNLVLPEYFKRWEFKCGTCLTKTFTINDRKTVQNLSVMILEAMIIPYVLKITLSTMCSILESYTFEEWSRNSLTIYPNILQLLKHDPFMHSMLPKVPSDILPSHFERMDLACIAHRLQYLSSTSHEKILMAELFPGCISTIDMAFKLNPLSEEPETEYTVKNHDRFIFTMKKGENSVVEVEDEEKVEEEETILFDVRANLCRAKPKSIYTYTLTNHPAVDGHFCLHDSSGIPTVFLIQYRHYGLKSNLNPVDWLNRGDFAKRAVEAFKEKKMEVCFVFITTTTLSEKTLEELKTSEYYNRVVLICYKPKEQPCLLSCVKLVFIQCGIHAMMM